MKKDKSAKQPSKRHLARALALQALYQWHFTQENPTEWISEFMAEQVGEPEKIDLVYFQKLVQGVAQNHTAIDEKITPHLDRAITALNPVEFAALRLATYELLFCPDVPPPVVINEAIELTKAFGATDGYKFVNAVLNALHRA